MRSGCVVLENPMYAMPKPSHTKVCVVSCVAILVSMYFLCMDVCVVRVCKFMQILPDRVVKKKEK